MKPAFTEFVSQKFEEKKAKNPKFSLRAFARQLQIPPGTLSRILSGNRKASPTWAAQVLSVLGASEAERRRILLGLIETPIEFEEAQKAAPHLMLSEGQLAAMNRWEFSAIRALLRTGAEFKDHRAVAKRLGIAQATAREALQVLELQKLAEFHLGRWRMLGEPSRTPVNPNPNVKKILREYTDLAFADRSLEADLYNISGITFVADPKHYQEIVERIRLFRQDLSDRFGKGKATRVFRLNLQLFPIDRGGEG